MASIVTSVIFTEDSGMENPIEYEVYLNKKRGVVIKDEEENVFIIISESDWDFIKRFIDNELKRSENEQ